MSPRWEAPDGNSIHSISSYWRTSWRCYIHMNCILFFPDKSVTVGLYLITMRWQIGRGFPFQPPSSFQLPASAKRFPWDLHPLSNYQLQHWESVDLFVFYISLFCLVNWPKKWFVNLVMSTVPALQRVSLFLSKLIEAPPSCHALFTFHHPASQVIDTQLATNPPLTHNWLSIVRPGTPCQDDRTCRV